MIASGSTGNYINAICQTILEFKVKLEEEFARVMLADGSEVHVQGYVQLILHCGNYKTRILTLVFPNLHDELILGIPWLGEENSTFDWADGRVTIERDGAIYILPCYVQRLNKPKGKEDERSTAEGIKFISDKAIQRRVQ